ncbi:MAG: thiolase family protein [Blautia sp.]|nr:thiolase family protein [Blautia sp.]
MVKMNRFSRSVSIIGIGSTPFMNTIDDPRYQGYTDSELFAIASLRAMEDAGIEPRDVDFFYHGSANPRMFNACVTPNMQYAEWLGMRGKASVHHSEACCSGYVALEQAVEDVASGAHDIVLTGGSELALGVPDGTKPAHFRKPCTLDIIIPDLDNIYERNYSRFLGGPSGVNFDDWMDLYVRENDLTAEQADEVLNTMSYHGRRAASLNPLAYFQESFDDIAKRLGFDNPMDYLKSAHNPKVSQYLRVYSNAPTSDGASAVIVCPTEMAHQFKQTPVEVLGVGSSSLDAINPHLEKRITAEAARQVYEITGVKPEELDLFLCNDFFLSSQLLAAEEVGYLPKGEGWKYVLDGRTAYDGDRPINPHGGRCAFGHAMGASGVADIYEAVLQMRGQAGVRQVKKLPKTTMIRGFGGSQNARAIILRTAQSAQE